MSFYHTSKLYLVFIRSILDSIEFDIIQRKKAVARPCIISNGRTDVKPTMTSANICQGVHGSCPKKKFDKKAVKASIRNPVSHPNDAPDIIISATTGF